MFSNEYDKAYNSVPKEMVATQDLAGRVRIAYAKFVGADAVLAVSTEIKMVKLPANARIVDWIIHHSDHGTTGAAKVGTPADDEALGTLDLTDEGMRRPAAEDDGIGLKVGNEPTDIIVELTTATTASVGEFIDLLVFYVVD